MYRFAVVVGATLLVAPRVAAAECKTLPATQLRVDVPTRNPWKVEDKSVPQIPIDQLDGFYRTIAVLTLPTTTATCAQLESDGLAGGFSNVSSTHFPASDGWTLVQRKITSMTGQDGKSSDEWQTNACREEGGVTLVVKVFETPDLDAMVYPLGGDARRILLEIIDDTPRIVASTVRAHRDRAAGTDTCVAAVAAAPYTPPAPAVTAAPTTPAAPYTPYTPDTTRAYAPAETGDAPSYHRRSSVHDRELGLALLAPARAGAERSTDGVALTAALPTTYWDGGGVLLALEGAGRLGTAGDLGTNVELGIGVGLGFSVGPLRFAWMGGVGYDTWTGAADIAGSTLAYHGPAARLRLGDTLALEADVRWRSRSGDDMRRVSGGLVYTGWRRKLGVTVEQTTLGDDPMLDIVGVGLRVGFGGALTRAR